MPLSDSTRILALLARRKSHLLTGGVATTHWIHRYVSVRYRERLVEAGVEPSVGSRGDSYDKAPAETFSDLYKAELIHRRAPWKTKVSLELETLEWGLFNHQPVLESIGYIPPAKAEKKSCRHRAEQATVPA